MRQATISNRLPLGSRVVLHLVAASSAVLGSVVVVALVVRAIGASRESSVRVLDMTLSNARTPAFTRGLPDLQASYSSVDLDITEPPASLRWLDLAQTAVGAAGLVAVCALLVWLCLATLRGRPFVATAPWVLISAGLATITTSVVSDLLAGRVQAAVVDLYGVDSTGGTSGEGFAIGTVVTLQGLGLALFLCVLGATFALGNRLQRDTDQLI